MYFQPINLEAVGMNQNVLQKDIKYCSYNISNRIDIADQDRAAIYCRLSKEDEDKLKVGDESASIQNQKMMLIDYALEKGFYVHDIYSDDNFTGFDQNRPDFNRLLMDAKLKKFNAIICKTQSRFTRDMELVEKYIHGLFPLLGIRFIGVADNIDTNIKGNKKSRQIHGLVNEWYSEDLSENIRKVFKTKMEKGQFLGAFAPYGYKKDPNNKHKLIIDEEAAAVVRKIFQYVIQGLGAKQICDILYDDGVPPPALYKRKKGLNYSNPNCGGYSSRGLWAVNSIRRMLRNRVYVGDMIQGRERKVSYKTSKCVLVPEEEWIIVPNCHKPIIDSPTFDLVQRILNQRKYEITSKTTGKKKIHIFAGKLKCKDCGSSITRIRGSGARRVYLYCKMHYRSKGKLCSRHSMILEDLTNIVSNKVKHIISCYLKSEAVSELKELISKDNDVKDRINQINKEIFNVEIKINDIKKAISMLYVDKVNGKISNEDYNELKQTLKDENSSYIKRLNTLNLEYSELEKKENNYDNLDVLINKYSDFKELTREIVNEFIDYIEIAEKDYDDSQEIVIHWNF